MDQRLLRDTLCFLVLVLAMSLLLFAAIPAIAENILESAPEVILPEPAEETENTGVSVLYLPTAVKMPDREAFVSEEAQYSLPRLTNEELERALAFMKDLEAGKELQWNDLGCAGRTEDVTVGVYPLDPEDFDGETFYVILPDARLTDDMLLSLLSAFDRLDIPFEPDSLNERNCMRGNRYDGGTRGLSYDENVRMENIRRRVHRGMIGPEQIPEGTYCRYADTAAAEYHDPYFHADPYRFCFYPYRQMTDNELAAFALAADGVWETDPDLLEKQALECVRGLLKVPLSLKAEREYRYRLENSKLTYLNYLYLTYTDERTGREIHPQGKPYEFIVEQIQHTKSGQPDLYSVHIYYYTSETPADPDSLHDRSLEEWSSLADAWAREALRIPEEKLPGKWEPGTDQGGFFGVEMCAETEDVHIYLYLNSRDGSPNTCYLLLKRR